MKNIPSRTIETNILGTTNLLEESRKKNIKRFIFASSYYSYANAGNLYTTSKTASELVIKNYNLLFGVNYTIIRYSTAYGPRNRNVDAISIFVKRALKNLDLIILGNGNQKRNYLHVEDLAEGSMIALNQKSKNKTITLTSKKSIKIISLAKMILNFTRSKSKIIFDKDRRRFDDFTSDDKYLQNKKNLFGWQPKYNLKTGLKQYIKMFS